jgi:hypothetical protein
MLERFSVPLTQQGKAALATLKAMLQGKGHDVWEMLLENIA